MSKPDAARRTRGKRSAIWGYTLMSTPGVAWFERERRYKEAIELLRKVLGR